MAVPKLPEFNIPNVLNRDGYIKLMKDVRPKLQGTISSFGLPVLAPTPLNNEFKFFDMLLRADKNEAITLRLQQDNLYLIGFRMEKSGQWLEFNPERSRLIPGSTNLGFTGSYTDMIAASGGEGLLKRSFGKDLLKTAVIQLNASNTTTAIRAKSLIVVIVMICESLRFTFVSDFLAETFNANNKTKSPNARFVALINNWGKLSEHLRKLDKDPTYKFPTDLQPAALEIHTYLDAVAVLGVLKEINARSTALLTTTTTIVVSDDQQQQYPLGEPMVEVISVKIDNNLCGGVVYGGTIQVIDGTGSQYIYYKTTPDVVKITKPTEFILLTTSPDRSILAYDSFTINVNLNTSSPKTPKEEDDDVKINGMISWNAFNTTTNVYDQPLHQVIKGEYGSSVTLNYVVLSDAVKAKLEVTLLKLAGDDDGSTGTDTTAPPVYGHLIARIGNFEEGSVLFKKASEENICVTPGQPIPLLRSFVAVPLNSSLIVQADISSPDHDIAKGTAEFPALLSGTSEKTISGKYGKIQVKVTWERET